MKKTAIFMFSLVFVLSLSGVVSADYTNSLGMEFKLIPAGTFNMGSPTDELGREPDEIQHQVTLTRSFYMQTTEVTQEQWMMVMGNNPSYFIACGIDCPVEEISWFDAQDFINALNQMGEGQYRLPTEAEWEYAARAGSSTAFANGGITEVECGYDPILDESGWYCHNSAVTYDGCNDTSAIGGPDCGGTHPVGEKEPNAWGLYDMHGNVYEYCQDWYGPYPSGSVTDPAGPSSGSVRVLRGGAWNRRAGWSRSAFRFKTHNPGSRSDNLGFRVVRENDLVAYYPFNGDADDKSGNGNHGTVQGASPIEERFGGAYFFDGQDDWITVPDSPSLDITGPITVSAWIKPENDQYWRSGIVSKIDGYLPHTGYGLRLTALSNDRYSQYGWFATYQSTSVVGDVHSDFTINDGDWHHITGTYDGSILKMYVDGEPQADTENYTGGITTNDVPMYIGKWVYPYHDAHEVRLNQVFHGVIDEVRIYNRALSEEEAVSLYEEYLTKILDFEDFLVTQDGMDITEIDPNYGGLDWSRPTSPGHWSIEDKDAAQVPFPGAPESEENWLKGHAIQVPPKGDFAKITHLNGNYFTLKSVFLRTRGRDPEKPHRDTNNDGIDDKWLETLTIRARDINNYEVWTDVILTDEWVLWTAEDLGFDDPNLDLLKSLTFFGDAYVQHPTGDRFAIDDLEIEFSDPE